MLLTVADIDVFLTKVICPSRRIADVCTLCTLLRRCVVEFVYITSNRVRWRQTTTSSGGHQCHDERRKWIWRHHRRPIPCRLQHIHCSWVEKSKISQTVIKGAYRAELNFVFTDRVSRENKAISSGLSARFFPLHLLNRLTFELEFLVCGPWS